eukprot:tig00000169_g11879.t1
MAAFVAPANPVRSQAIGRCVAIASPAVCRNAAPAQPATQCEGPAPQSVVFELQRVFSAVSIPGGSGGLKGGAAVLERPSVIGDVDVDTAWATFMARRKAQAPKYRVLLFNDPFNKREHVVQSLLKVIDGLTTADAVEIMSKAHNEGFAVAAVVVQEVAELYVEGLRSCGLTATCEPDE